MTRKIASLLMKASNVISLAALVVVVIGPMMWLDLPYLSVWPLAHAVIALWSFTPETHKRRDLWLAGIFRIAITVWELIDMRFLSEGIHPVVSVGLWILLVGAVLYVIGLALWNAERGVDTGSHTA